MKKTLVILTFVLIGCQTEDQFELKKGNNLQEIGLTSTFSMARIGDPIETTSDFIWGINGHPVSQEGYSDSRVPYSSQLEYLTTFGLIPYRVDVPVNSDGSVVRESDLTTLVNLADQSNIMILPMIYLSGLDYSDSETVSRTKGYNLGVGFANRYQNMFDYIQMGNEQELKGILGSGLSGSQTSHYDIDKFNVLAAFWEGLNSGIKEVNSSIKTSINCSGWYHYGLFQLIDDYSFENRQIEYDIIGYHWYSEMGDLDRQAENYQGNIFELLESRYPSKDVWITEINRRNGSINEESSGGHSFLEPANKEAAEAFWIDRYISQLENLPNVKAFFVYELLEQPYFDDGLGFEAPHEAYFGVVEFLEYSSNPSNRRKQSATYEIREQTLGYQDYIKSLYKYFNKRDADNNGLTYWTNKIKLVDNSNDSELLSFINEFLREEAYKTFIEDVYKLYLGRNGDSGGIQYWTNRLKTDLTREQVIAKFCSGSEFSGSLSDEDFIRKLYKTLLKREVDGSGFSSKALLHL